MCFAKTHLLDQEPAVCLSAWKSATVNRYPLQLLVYQSVLVSLSLDEKIASVVVIVIASGPEGRAGGNAFGSSFLDPPGT